MTLNDLVLWTVTVFLERGEIVRSTCQAKQFRQFKGVASSRRLAARALPGHCAGSSGYGSLYSYEKVQEEADSPLQPYGHGCLLSWRRCCRREYMYVFTRMSHLAAYSCGFTLRTTPPVPSPCMNLNPQLPGTIFCFCGVESQDLSPISTTPTTPLWHHNWLSNNHTTCDSIVCPFSDRQYVRPRALWLDRAIRQGYPISRSRYLQPRGKQPSISPLYAHVWRASSKCDDVGLWCNTRRRCGQCRGGRCKGMLASAAKVNG